MQVVLGVSIVNRNKIEYPAFHAFYGFVAIIAINAVVGALLDDDRLVIRKLDNCSITLLERDSAGNLRIAQSGHEADTLIR